MIKKLYTAFISSAFESLRDERADVIDCLLDSRIFPVCMEHFTISSFSDIEELIDDSDFVVLLLGRSYGSLDEDGQSFTEREYEYAVLKQKPLVAIICDELVANLSKDISTLSEDEQRQIKFCQRISFARKVSDEFSIKTILRQFISSNFLSISIGWSRIENTEMSQADLERWREEHSVYDLAGNWYHVHLSEDDEEYIRVGTVKIEQDFAPDKYLDLHIEGLNHNVLYYDKEKETVVEDKMKSSHFSGEYKMQTNGEIFGIFNVTRTFNGTFNSQDVQKGRKRGIHDFTIDIYQKKTFQIDGEFHDEAPSPKLGRIFLFRNINDRNDFLLATREHVVKQR